jgi:hypothetical protein
MSGADRRQFGRRQTSLRAWISVPGRPRLPCLVRNISLGGAFLEINAPTWLPYVFHLTVESTGFDADCEVRHQSATSIGVRFIERVAAGASDGARNGALPSTDDTQEWMGARR